MNGVTRRYELRIWWRSVNGRLRWMVPVAIRDGEDQDAECDRLARLSGSLRDDQPYWVTKQEVSPDNRHIGDRWVVRGKVY